MIVHLVCVVHIVLFCFWTVGGFVPHVWVHASVRHCVETLVPCSLVCLCVGWLNVSLVWGSMHPNVIVWGCVCVLCVCMSVSCLCMRFCGDVVKFFALARCVCVWGVSFSQSQHPMKKRKQTIKNTKRQNHEKQITWTTHTHTTDTQWRPWEGMFSRTTRKNNVRSNFLWFTASCNSQCLSHFVASFIVVRAKTTIIGLDATNENGKYWAGDNYWYKHQFGMREWSFCKFADVNLVMTSLSSQWWGSPNFGRNVAQKWTHESEPTPFMVSDERALAHLNPMLGSSLIANTAHRKMADVESLAPEIHRSDHWILPIKDWE